MSNFRIWLQKIWMQHKQETFTWSGHFPDYEMAYYVSKYRWWLRREYRYQNQYGERTDST